MKFPKTPAIVKPFARDLVWNISTAERIVYLTFDDGPVSGVTDVILDILESFNAKATFFCLGKQIEQNKALFERIKSEGHVLGNHSYNHPNGWKTNNQEYFDNVEKGNQLIRSKLFRPPYGRITLPQVKRLKESYKIIMWDVLSYDYDNSVTIEQCYKNVIENVEEGSIVVFHDSEKGRENVLNVLPKVLEYYSKKGYGFKSLAF